MYRNVFGVPNNVAVRGDDHIGERHLVVPLRPGFRCRDRTQTSAIAEMIDPLLHGRIVQGHHQGWRARTSNELAPNKRLSEPAFQFDDRGGVRIRRCIVDGTEGLHLIITQSCEVYFVTSTARTVAHRIVARVPHSDFTLGRVTCIRDHDVQCRDPSFAVGGTKWS